jgi:predicted TIM-barrel fold metal-dependent hydrolase
MRNAVWTLAAVLAATCTSGADLVPIADHHQHLFSPAIAERLSTAERTLAALTAQDLVAHLDAAGIRRATVLSVAYMWGRPSWTVEDEYEKVRAENDWTAAQAARYPGRLRAFCGVNPLKGYALDEIARCAKDPHLRHGLKLHFGNSDVQLEKPEHAAQLRRVFAAANEHGMAIVVHMRASVSLERPYGADQAQVFLEQLLSAAPHVPVQIAHMASTGPGFDDPPGQAAMSFLADAVARGDRRTRNLWFDVASSAGGDNPPAVTTLLVRLIRRVGVKRVLFGSDAAVAPNVPPKEAWAVFRRLPLTEKEFATIARNVAPYLR